MLLNQSQIYESQHESDNITEDEINYFVEKMQKKYQTCLKKMDQGQYDRLYGDWVGMFESKDVGVVEVYQGQERTGDGRKEGRVLGDKRDGENLEEKQSASTVQGLECKLCRHQFNAMTSLVRKYTCGLCLAVFCQNCLGRFQAHHLPKKQPSENQQQQQQQNHSQSTPTCKKCDHEHMKSLARIENHRFCQLGRQVLKKLKNQVLELELEINYEKSNPKLLAMSAKTSSTTNKSNKLTNKQTQLIIANGILQGENAEIRKKIEYGLVVQKQLSQKCIQLQRKLSRSINIQQLKIKPACPYESQTGQSQTDILSHKESVLEDETRKIDSRSFFSGKKCGPCCSVM